MTIEKIIEWLKLDGVNSKYKVIEYLEKANSEELDALIKSLESRKKYTMEYFEKEFYKLGYDLREDYDNDGNNIFDVLTNSSRISFCIEKKDKIFKYRECQNELESNVLELIIKFQKWYWSDNNE